MPIELWIYFGIVCIFYAALFYFYYADNRRHLVTFLKENGYVGEKQIDFKKIPKNFQNSYVVSWAKKSPLLITKKDSVSLVDEKFTRVKQINIALGLSGIVVMVSLFVVLYTFYAY